MITNRQIAHDLAVAFAKNYHANDCIVGNLPESNARFLETYKEAYYNIFHKLMRDGYTA